MAEAERIELPQPLIRVIAVFKTVKRASRAYLRIKLDAAPGIEPRLEGPKPSVLPLHHAARLKWHPYGESNSGSQDENLVF